MKVVSITDTVLTPNGLIQVSGPDWLSMGETRRAMNIQRPNFKRTKKLPLQVNVPGHVWMHHIQNRSSQYSCRVSQELSLA